MQLQSIDQVYEGQTVFHPVYGECEVLATNPDYGVKVNTPKLGQYEIFRPEELHTSPVTVIAESEVTRLNDLVKAQEELLEIMDVDGCIGFSQSFAPDVNRDETMKMVELRNKINQLQSKTDK